MAVKPFLILAAALLVTALTSRNGVFADTATSMVANCDDLMKVFFDGVEQAAPDDAVNEWDVASTYTIPSGTQEVGIECQNTDGKGGILAELNDGIMTDQSWACSVESLSAATTAATMLGENDGNYINTVIDGISTDAQWIWTPNNMYSDGDRTVFCKVTLPQSTSPCTSLKPLVEDLQISDDSITASSIYGDDHPAYRVRTDNYFNSPCAWVGASDDSEPWVQFDMGVDVTVSAVLVKPRCDVDDQRVLSFNLKGSDDGFTWFDASEDITVDYVDLGTDGEGSLTYLANLMTGRYWRINLLTWNMHRSLKAELLGQVAPQQTSLTQLVEDLQISDDSITASSIYGDDHPAYRVRTDNYFNSPCAWVAATGDIEPWVQFDMEVDVTVSAVLVKPRCDQDEQRVVSFNLMVSCDGVSTWFDALGDTTTDYVDLGTGGEGSMHYLPEPMTGRYWRINVLTWENNASLKADFFGQVAGG